MNYTETVESNGTDIVAHYVPSSQDSDGDGVADWYELYNFGDLNQTGSDDPDGDGYTIAEELALGQESTIEDSVEWGGVSGRLSDGILYFQQQNRPPSNLELNNTIAFLNKDANQTIGSFTPTDPDDPNLMRTFQYRLLNQSGGEDNQKYNLLGNQLRASQTFTVEGNHSILVRVTDDENASFDKNFTISAINPLRDDDGDGLGFEAELIAGTNPKNPDTDGDGASDGSEVSANKDPLDPNAYPNRPPRDLNSTAVLAFSENQPVGTVIGEFNATDPDGDAITYHFVNGENNNSLFSLDTNGTLKTATTFDYESNNSSYTITVQAKDELNATTEGNFTVTLLDVFEDLDQDGTADHLDDGVDGDGFSNEKETLYKTESLNSLSIPGHIGNYQAEDADFTNAQIRNEFFTQGSGWSGTGAIDFNEGGIVDWNVTVPYDGLYNFRIKVSGGANGIACDLEINGVPIQQSIPFPNTGGWGAQWDFMTFEKMRLKEGENSIVFKESGGQQANFDELDLFQLIDFNVSDFSLAENQQIGTVIGEFNSSLSRSSITYHFVNGENNNSLFTLDINGTLKTATAFDYESNASSYTITVQAKDELNATTEGNFTVTLVDVYEDTDGDGFRDSLEASTGSNLNDPNSTPLQQGLVAWYPFDGNASDMSGNGNHGTVNGATLGTDYHGKLNSAYSFDGLNDYIEINSSETLSFSDEISLSFWMKPTKWGIDNTKLAGVISKKGVTVMQGL